MSERDVKTDELDRIVKLFRNSRLHEAKNACKSLLEQENSDKEPLYLILLEIAKIEEDRYLTFYYLDCLIELFPYERNYYEEKAELYYQLGKPTEGIKCFEQFITKVPDHPVATYNFAFFLRRNNQLKRAIKCYLKALELNIDDPAEVYLNIGAIYSELHEPELAVENYLQALSLERNYVPALYNLGGIYEEQGRKEEAIQTYSQILSTQPNNVNTLSRLAHLHDNLSLESVEVVRLKAYIENSGRDSASLQDAETACFALGKVYEQLENYAIAFRYYAKANELGEQRTKIYSPADTSLQMERLKRHLNRSWYETNRTDDDSAPIFVCGMLRSGSTLIESLLSAHPEMRSGGELNFLEQAVRVAAPDKDLIQLDQNDIRKISEGYQNQLNTIFGDDRRVVDKRLDNFVNIGVIKAAFPKSRIICTDRDPLDICLSIYFQQLSSSLSYATNLANIAHYYLEYKAMLRHWMGLFPNEIHVVSYDQLVQEPLRICSELFNYCGVVWNEKYLKFYESKDLVKTASLWQVRKPLYKKTARRQHYQKELCHLKEVLADA